MHIFEPLSLEPQPGLAHVFDQAPAAQAIGLATVEQTLTILQIMGWPTAVKPNILLARMPVGWASDIHRDTNPVTQAPHQTVINIPVVGQHYMEWFEQVDPTLVVPTVTPGWHHSIPWLDPKQARMTTQSRDCGLSYLCNSGVWHRVVNGGLTPALVVSVRYADWSHLPWDQALANTPWVQQLRHR